MSKFEMTPQARRAIDKMLAAGFKRSQFRVRTQIKRGRTSDGYTYKEYGDAHITIWSDKAALPLVPAMVREGLDVIIYKPEAEGTRPMIFAEVNKRYDFDNRDAHGDAHLLPTELTLTVHDKNDPDELRRQHVTDLDTIQELVSVLVRRWNSDEA